MSVAGFADVGLSYSASKAINDVTAVVRGGETQVHTNGILDIDADSSPSLSSFGIAFTISGAISVNGAPVTLVRNRRHGGCGDPGRHRDSQLGSHIGRRLANFDECNLDRLLGSGLRLGGR